MEIKGYDSWLWKQADDYMSAMDSCYDEDDPCGECDWCEDNAKRDYEESRADYLYEQERERRYYDKYN